MRILDSTDFLLKLLKIENHSISSQPITDVQIDSRLVKSGTLFFGLQGNNVNGSDYAQDAINRGKNGAEVFYNLAKTRGYEKGKETTEKSEIETLKEVKEVAKNTGLGTSGDTPKGQVSLSDLAGMNDAEFDKLTSGDNWRNMMGG